MRSSLPVALYLPNLLGYARILLAFYALHVASHNPVQAVLLFIASAALDLFDGILARALNQTSDFGILLDIAADNILRTCGWLAAATTTTTTTSTSRHIQLVAGFFICIEWTTMLCTQLHAATSQQHWKDQRDQDPWLVRALFANGFKNPLGCLAMYGLFSSYLWTYGAAHAELYEAIPFFEVFQYASYAGRALSLVVECYMIQSYASLVLEKDSRNDKSSKGE